MHAFEFSISQLEEIEQDESFASKMFVRDEALFHTHGGVNRHNFRYWAAENPHWSTEIPLQPDRVNVWVGICAKGVVGPYFFDGRLNGSRYDRRIMS